MVRNGWSDAGLSRERSQGAGRRDTRGFRRPRPRRVADRSCHRREPASDRGDRPRARLPADHGGEPRRARYPARPRTRRRPDRTPSRRADHCPVAGGRSAAACGGAAATPATGPAAPGPVAGPAPTTRPSSVGPAATAATARNRGPGPTAVPAPAVGPSATGPTTSAARAPDFLTALARATRPHGTGSFSGVAGVIAASEQSRTAPCSGPIPCTFGKPVTVLRCRGADAVRKGRAWSLVHDRSQAVRQVLRRRATPIAGPPARSRERRPARSPRSPPDAPERAGR